MFLVRSTFLGIEHCFYSTDKHLISLASYYTDKYALWLDFRTIDDNRLYGSGRGLENTSEGICLQITKEAGASAKLSCYLYLFQDAQINISDAQFLNVVY